MPHAWEGGQADGSGMKLVGRRTILVAALFGLTGCIGSQDDDKDDSGQAEANTAENNTTAEEFSNDDDPPDDEPEADSEYTDVTDDVYAVESVGPGEYRITADESRLIGGSMGSLEIQTSDEEHSLLQVSDTNPELYANDPTDEGNAVWFYDDDFANEDQVQLQATWSQGAHVEGVDEPEDEVLYETAEVPDTYIDEVEDGLYKATIPFNDFYEDWDNLARGAAVTLTLGHLDESSDPDAIWYAVGVNNHPDED